MALEGHNECFEEFLSVYDWLLSCTFQSGIPFSGGEIMFSGDF